MRGRALWPLAGLAFMAVMVGLWQVVASQRLVSPVYLPSPDRVARALVVGLWQGTLLEKVGATVARMAVGWLLASLLGIGIGLLIGLAPRLRAWLQPTLEVLRPLPASAMVPVAIALFGLSDSMVLAVVAFGAIWPMLLATVHGCAAVEPRLIEVARTLRLSRAAIAWKIAIPSGLPDILGGMRIGLTIALILTIVGEMLGGRDGLGYWILLSARNFRAADLYAGVVLLGLLGCLTAQGLNWVERRVLKGGPALQGRPEMRIPASR